VYSCVSRYAYDESASLKRLCGEPFPHARFSLFRLIAFCINSACPPLSPFSFIPVYDPVQMVKVSNIDLKNVHTSCLRYLNDHGNVCLTIGDSCVILASIPFDHNGKP
jgi:hypothetical protein